MPNQASGRKLRSFREVPNQKDKRNPESLRRILFEIFSKRNQGNLALSAKELNRVARRRRDRNLRISFSEHVLYDLINDRIHIKYAHLDAIGQLLGVPVSFILFYSRIFANQSDKYVDETNHILDAYTTIIAEIRSSLADQKAAPLQHSDFEEWCGLFRRNVNEYPEQSDLFAVRET